MEEIINEFEEFCGNLAISGDSPSAETIKQYFDRYAKALQLQQTGVSGCCDMSVCMKLPKCSKQCKDCASVQ